MSPLYTFRACSFFLLMALSALPTLSNATNNYVTELQENAVTQQLWHDQVWINLMHYDIEGKDKYLSQVDDERFFNAENGKTHSREELLATIAAFYRTDVKDNEHPQCRFLARLNWLQKKLSINAETLPVENCEDYKEWQEIIKSDSVTLVFPAYNLNSPSSMYGHTLLRLDKKFGDTESDWLSYSINFGANIDESEERSMFYAFKGLTGGYPGNFVVGPYFKKIKEYNRIENRDIWEYTLNLTPEETQQMVLHLWELKEMNFDYFFFDENCSYRLLELLEVARPSVELTDEFVVTAIPVDTVRAIERAGMIDVIEYRPSQQTTLQHLFKQMPREDLDYIKKVSTDLSVTEDASFTSLSNIRKRNIVDASYRYLRFNESEKIRDAVTARHSYQLLALLNTYPTTEDTVPPPQPVPPERSHESNKVSLTLGERLDRGYMDIGFRMSFHDLEDNEHGFLRGAQINIVSFNIRTDSNNTTRLNRLDFVDIFSARPRDRFFNPLTWRIYTGFERQLTRDKDVLVSHVTGGIGATYTLWNNSQIYGLGTLRLEHNNNMNNVVEPGIGVLTGLLHHFGSHTARLELSGEEFDDDIYRVKSVYKHNFVISTNHSLKILAAREWHSSINFSEFSLSYQYYF